MVMEVMVEEGEVEARRRHEAAAQVMVEGKVGVRRHRPAGTGPGHEVAAEVEVGAPRMPLG
jgi:hypothetical protein